MQKDFDSLCKEKTKEFIKSLYKVEQERQKSFQTLLNISILKEKIQKENSTYHTNKLQGQLKIALAEIEVEESKLRESLALIEDIRKLDNEKRIAARTQGAVEPRSSSSSSNKGGQSKETIRRGALMKMLEKNAITLPLFISSKKEVPPPLCGAIQAEPNYIAKVGDIVAALVKGVDGDENWIVAEVLGYSHGTNKYQLLDIDEEQKEKQIICRRHVVPLPLMKANYETNPEAFFPKGTLVMALYPQTTCFYRALVHCCPKTLQDGYQVLFEDTSYPNGYAPPFIVAQRYVLIYKETRKK